MCAMLVSMWERGEGEGGEYEEEEEEEKAQGAVEEEGD